MKTGMNVKRVLIVGVLAMCSIVGVEYASMAAGRDELIKYAGQLHKRDQHGEALEIYRELLKKEPDSKILNFNAGTICYKKGDFEDGIDHLKKAVVTSDLVMERDSLYLIGNSYYRLSEEKEKKDLNGSINLCHKALEYYRWAIEVDGYNRNVKFNYEAAGKRLAALDERKNKEPPPPKGGDGSGDGDGSGAGVTRSAGAHGREVARSSAARLRRNHAGRRDARGELARARSPDSRRAERARASLSRSGR